MTRLDERDRPHGPPVHHHQHLMGRTLRTRILRHHPSVSPDRQPLVDRTQLGRPMLEDTARLTGHTTRITREGDR